MQLGALNKQITLYTTSETTLASGQKQVQFTEEITLFANIEYKSGGEATEAGQKVASENVIFTIHNVITNLNKQRKLVYNGESYEITRIIPDHHHEFFLKIECKVRDNTNVGI